jgi:hypothetical protein
MENNMLKLTYSEPNDEFPPVTVLGDAGGIFHLYSRLSLATWPDPSHGLVNIRICDLDGVPIDINPALLEAICVFNNLPRDILP